MPLHIIKLAVGCESVKELKSWVAERMRTAKSKGLPRHHIHITRMTPKRVDEVLDGGSLYWVIRGEIAAREKIIAIEPFRDKDGIGRCRLVMQPKVIARDAAADARVSGLALFRARATLRRISVRRGRALRICPNRCAANCAISVCSSACDLSGRRQGASAVTIPKPLPIRCRQLALPAGFGILVDDVEQFRLDAHFAEIQAELFAEQRRQALAPFVRYVRRQPVVDCHAAEHHAGSLRQAVTDATDQHQHAAEVAAAGP